MNLDAGNGSIGSQIDQVRDSEVVVTKNVDRRRMGSVLVDIDLRDDAAGMVPTLQECQIPYRIREIDIGGLRAIEFAGIGRSADVVGEGCSQEEIIVRLIPVSRTRRECSFRILSGDFDARGELVETNVDRLGLSEATQENDSEE